MTNYELRRVIADDLSAMASKTLRQLRRVVRGAVTLVDDYPHACNAVILSGVLLSGLLNFACLRRDQGVCATAAATAPGGGDAGPPDGQLHAAPWNMSLPPLMTEEGFWDRFLHNFTPATGEGERDGERKRDVMREGMWVYCPLFLFLVLATALVWLLTVHLQKSEPTQLQLVEGVWCYSPIPPRYRAHH